MTGTRTSNTAILNEITELKSFWRQDIKSVSAEIEKMRGEMEHMRIEAAATGGNCRLHEQSLDRLCELVEKHEKTLYGNGSEGITTKISNMSKNMKLYAAIGSTVGLGAAGIIVERIINLIIK